MFYEYLVPLEGRSGNIGNIAQQATSNKQQATSNKQQATSNKQQAIL
ncbi:MAG: hypothetical protein LBB43_02985 [Spirochaetaceae bacterium]|jgi:hypothetical protein|nr:hypothetical protein [Spirochaetaceae bacterium]